MDRGTFTPTRLIILLLAVGLALGIGLAVAQTQSAAQPSGETPKSVAQTQEAAQPATDAPGIAAEKPAETLETPAAAAEETEAPAAAAEDPAAGRTLSRMRSTTQSMRKAAARLNAKRRADLIKRGASQPLAGTNPCNTPQGVSAPLGMPCGNVDYFGTTPNYALSKLPLLTVNNAPTVPATYTVSGGIRKFVDTLAGLGPANKNNLGNYIPIATPKTNVWDSTSDYYEIGLKDYRMQFNSDLPGLCTTSAAFATSCTAAPATGPTVGTQLRGYRDLNGGAAVALGGDTNPHYLGPLILAQRDRPVRIKFTNELTPATPLFIPADPSYMGMTHDENGIITNYSTNRATLHLHGGVTPWISDGTPHQWTVPALEYPTATYKRGVSTQMVPDMFFDAAGLPSTTSANTEPGNGALTFFYTNAQSGRLMFYHDHAWGITRLNVYAGEAAGYLLHDGPGLFGKKTLDDLIGAGIPNNFGADATSEANLTATAIAPLGLHVTNGGLYQFGIPLVIQDKSFVPPSTPQGAGLLNPSLGIFPNGQLNAQDPSWNWGAEGDLWFPHVYMPNQNPNDDAGASSMGRWDYGPWFWPPMTSASLAHGATNCVGTGDISHYSPIVPTCPGTLNPSGVPEAFMDTPVVNGTAYPSVTLPAGAYRFQVLNAANDRFLNMSVFYAADKDGNVCKTGYNGTFNNAAMPTANAKPADWHTCTEVKMVAATPHRLIMPFVPLPTTALDADDTLPACASSPAQPDVTVGPGYLVTANVGAVDYNSVTGLPGTTNACWPSSWPTDGRDGGVPDPASAGPAIVQLGTEGGVLPAPVVIPATPVGYNYNRRDIVVTNVQEHALFIGPAERADIIVDLSSATPGDTLMLYNDSPAPVPGYDVRLDYYTGAPDLSDTGGAPIVQAGYGPNVHTLMQIHIVAAVSGTPANGYNLATLQSSLGIPKVFHDTQPQIIVPETAYSPVAMGTTLSAPKDTFARIQNTTGLTFQPFNGTGGFAAQTITQPIINKAIHELFESDYGKMNSILAAEIPLTNFNNQTTIPLAYVDPPTEIVNDGQVQLWKITHNGVDSHAMHFHLFNVQLINRVGWDGAIRAADANELGWKETVRMNPLEDAIVAIRPDKPPIPNTLAFKVPLSNRLLDPSRAEHATNTTGLPGFTNIDANGNPVTTRNEYTNFGWEYVWHCHLLGHEESDMMRPLVLKLDVPDSPTNLVAVANTGTGGGANLTWSWAAGANLINATGFMVQRAPVGGAFITVPGAGALPVSPLSFNDTTAVAGSYVYRVYAFNGSALSGSSNTSAVVVIGAALAAPTNLRTTLNVNSTVALAWTDLTPAGATGFSLERACVSACGTISTSYAVIATTAVTTLNYTNRNIPVGNLPKNAVINYRVRATGPNGAVSPFSNVLPVTVN